MMEPAQEQFRLGFRCQDQKKQTLDQRRPSDDGDDYRQGAAGPDVMYEDIASPAASVTTPRSNSSGAPRSKSAAGSLMAGPRRLTARIARSRVIFGTAPQRPSGQAKIGLSSR